MFRNSIVVRRVRSRVSFSGLALSGLLSLGLTLGSLLAVVGPSEGQTWTATWTQRADPPPGSRAWVDMAFDTVQGRAVLFGGTASQPLNDVWQYDTAADKWLQLEPAQACPSDMAHPTGLAGSSLEYDPLNQVFWIFGGAGVGCNGSARIAGKGTTTTAIVDLSLPATTVDFYKGWTVSVGDSSTYVSAYNPAMKMLTLATPLAGARWWNSYFLYSQRGGGTFSYSPSGKSWGTQTGSEPASRLSPAMVYSSRGAAIVMFGGQGLNDTWALDLRTKSWKQMIPNQGPGSPPGLAQLTNAMVYDSNNDVFILFGGCLCASDAGPSSGDTWAYQLSTNTWSRMTPAVSPPARQGHSLVYDSTNKAVVLFGGLDMSSGRYLNDLWVYRYDINSWTQVFPFGSPPGRRAAAMVYDSILQRTVLYGGANAGSLQDVWTLQLQRPSTVSAAPILTSVSPTSAIAGSPGFTLTVTGANFGGSSVVQWMGSPRPTTYVRSTQLQASIPASDITSGRTAQISVATAGPGGGTSSSLDFAVTSPQPAPTLTKISPTSTVAGTGAFTLTATGSGFAASSVLRINGANRATTVLSATQLTASILASDVPAAGILSVTVFTPAPGGGTSAGQTLTVSDPAPVVSTGGVQTGGSTTTPPTLSLVFNGMLRDRVGQGMTAISSDGMLDGTLTATLSAGRTITSLRLDSDRVGTWVTGQNVTKNWVLGVALSLDGSLLNASSSMAVNFPVAGGGSFVVFAADYLSREFVPGAKLTLVATFSDGSTATASTTVATPPSTTSGSSTGQSVTASGVSAPVPGSIVLPAGQPVSAQTAPPVGTWATIAKTVLYPAIPFEAKPESAPYARPELWSPQSVFANSGATDVVQWNGVWGFFIWGGGHAATPDNSLYWVPFDGSGPRALTGPYLAPDGIYDYAAPLETHRSISRNQTGLNANCATEGLCSPRSRHTYSSLLVIAVNGKPAVFSYGGSLNTGSGSGTSATRVFDLSLTPAQAMARPDMGWQLKAPAPAGAVASFSGWDPVQKRVVVRGSHFIGAYYPDQDRWEDWQINGPSFCCDFGASVAMDLVGRKMYVLGGGLAEMIDLDTKAWRDLSTQPWTAKFAARSWGSPAGYMDGPGVAWHAATKTIVAWPQVGNDLLVIDPVAGTTKTATMAGATLTPAESSGTWGRFRLIPGSDQVVLLNSVDQNAFIGTVPFGVASATLSSTQMATPTQTSVAPPAPSSTSLPATTSAPSLSLAFNGMLRDRVGQGVTAISSDGMMDGTLTATLGAGGTITALRLDSDQVGTWVTGQNAARNWVLGVALAPDGSLLNVANSMAVNFPVPSGGSFVLFASDYLSREFVPGAKLTLVATFSDGSTATASTTVPTPLQAPTPTATSTSTPPVSAPGPSSGTVRVAAGSPLPVRQWVERLLPTNTVCNYSGDGNGFAPAELCGLGPSKHTRVFYHPTLKSLVIGGGDRPVGAHVPGFTDGTGSEIISLSAATDTWTTIRPFCVASEPQPGRPDNVTWALDLKRNRALMAPGFYFISQAPAGGFPPSGPSGCGAKEGWGGYALDFGTKKWSAPDDPAIFPPPPGGWGGDNGATYAVVDPVNDELIRVYTGVGLQRMNLATKVWRTTPYNLAPTRSQTVIDVQGRAIYFLLPFGVDGVGTKPVLVKMYLDAPKDGQVEYIPLPWKFQSFSGDSYLAFDTVNRLVFVPNNISMGGPPMVGLGIYHVDTGVWEWEDTPPVVGSSLFGFDESLGALVAMGNRAAPLAYYIYKYGGTIKPLPPEPLPPVVQTTALVSETFAKADGPGLGPLQPWTIVEGGFGTVSSQATVASDKMWSSARAEKDLPGSDMEVWATSTVLDSPGTYMLEIQQGVAARFSPSSASYYLFEIMTSDATYFRLYRVVNGVRTQLGQTIGLAGSNSNTTGAEFRLRVTGTGATVALTGFYRGQVVVTAADTAPARIVTGTRAGIIGYGLSNSGYLWRLSNWKAGAAAGN